MNKVCGHYIAVKPDNVEKKSKGGIVLAEDYDSNQHSRAEAAATTGIVIDVGDMSWKAYDGNHPEWKPWCEKGDRIVFTRHVAKIYNDKDDLDDDGNPKKIFIIADENVLMVIS